MKRDPSWIKGSTETIIGTGSSGDKRPIHGPGV